MALRLTRRNDQVVAEKPAGDSFLKSIFQAREPLKSMFF